MADSVVVPREAQVGEWQVCHGWVFVQGLGRIVLNAGLTE